MSASKRANAYSKTVRAASLRDVARYIHERHVAYLFKTGVSATPPTDPAILNYAFTNLSRALDKGTTQLQALYDTVDPALCGFVVAVGRTINSRPLMLEYLPALVPYRADKLIQIMGCRKRNGLTVRGNAYLVATHAHAEPFEVFYGTRVFPGWWQARHDLLRPHTSLGEYAAWLRGLYGVGPFLCGQIIADLKPRLAWMQAAPDRDDWFVLGPGSTRATHVLRTDASVVPKVRELSNYILEHEHCADYRVDAQDAQNILCEFDKYWRISTGYGYRRKRVTLPNGS